MSKRENKKEVYQPDDRFFKKIMESRENAESYLKEFYPQIAGLLDLESLEFQPDGFMTSDLKVFKSDVIYKCRFKDSEEEMFCSLIWENKSEPDENVAIQIGLYVFLAMYKMVKSKDENIRPVLPLLFYNGKKNWEPKTIHQLFEAHPHFEELKRFLPNFDFLFKNIATTPQAELRKIENIIFRNAMIAMHYRFKIDLLIQNISFIFEGISKEDDGLSFSTYIFGIVERSPEELIASFKNLSPVTKSYIMSALEILKNEGRVEGKIEGKIEGRAEGETTGAIKRLLVTFAQAPELEDWVLSKTSGFPTNIIAELRVSFNKDSSIVLLQCIQKLFYTNGTMSEDVKADFMKLIESLR